MSALSRNKGKRGEAELATIFDARGLRYLREQDGRTQGADYRVGPFAIEAKRRNRLRICEWSRELEAEVTNGIVPVVAYRPDREPWRASMLLADWLELADLAEALR